MLGEPEPLADAVLALAEEAVRSIDLSAHDGVHPRFGVLDVVPFTPVRAATLDAAIRARELVIGALGSLGIPAFRYGPLPDGTVRTLPNVRRTAFRGLMPDAGPSVPHPTAGATAVGARGALVAWNIWLQGATLEETIAIAALVRSSQVRALGLAVSGATQVSCNLVAPTVATPRDVYRQVEAGLTAGAHVVRCELVGLVPEAVLAAVPEAWWERLDLAADRSVEAAAARLGLDA